MKKILDFDIIEMHILLINSKTMFKPFLVPLLSIYVDNRLRYY